jgi:hypothetical protein
MAMATITDVQAELHNRLARLPGKGLENIKTYLRNTGMGALAGTLVDVFESAATPAVSKDTLSVQLEDFTYGPATMSERPPLVQSHVFTNGTSQPQKETFSYKYLDSEEFQFGFSEGLTIGVKASATAEVPGFSEQVEISAQFQFTADQRWTYASSVEVSNNEEITIDPHSSVTATSTTTYGSSTAPFHAHARVTSGTAMFLCFQRGFPEPTVVVSIPVINVLSGNELVFEVGGTMSGAKFLSDVVHVTSSGGATEVMGISHAPLAHLGDTGLSSQASGL